MAQQLAVILGAGPVGRSVGDVFRERGVAVRFVTRSGRGPEGFETLACDAAHQQALEAACQGASVVVHAVGVPYQSWAAELPGLQTAVLGAATATGAVAVFVENLYSYTADTMPLTEASPEVPASRKGALRLQLTRQWQEAHAAGTVKAVSVRASDYFGPGATRADTSHFGSRFFPGLEAGKAVSFLGDPDAEHSFTYLPDFARALVDVALSPDAWGRAWVCPSLAPSTTRKTAERFAAAAGVTAQVGRLPRAGVKLLGLFSPMIREVVEMLYQFEKPFTVDASAFEKRFGWKSADWDRAITETWASHRKSPR
jgi:nucleoside-diphosphate-sugar epimerase